MNGSQDQTKKENRLHGLAAESSKAQGHAAAETIVTAAGIAELEAGSCVIEVPADPCAIIIIGACGDLARRKLFQAFFRLFTNGGLPDPFVMIGVDVNPMTSEQYHGVMRDALQRLGGETIAEQTWRDFVKRLWYVSVVPEGKVAYAPLANLLEKRLASFGMPGNRLFYLAVPPKHCLGVIAGLGEVGLANESDRFSGWARVVIEKPFGRDLESAKYLNDRIQRHFQEDQIYRIDHYLAKETVQNILMFRFANTIFEPIWHREYIDHVQITAAETLGVEHRAAYYEQTGVLRDMFQNHMLQLLAMIAMEPPSLFEADRVRDEKTKVFRSLRPFAVEALDRHLVLGQYVEGSIDGLPVCGYRSEPGVDKDSLTPTLAVAKVFVDNWRWHGVPFYLRSGKRMAKKATEIAIQFKDVPSLMFRNVLADRIHPNVLVLRIQPDERITMTFQAKVPGAKVCLQPVTMDFHYSKVGQGPFLGAYEKVILDCLLGDQMLFVRQDGVELCWAFLSPILEACERCDDRAKALHFYRAGTWGPDRADALMAAEGRAWHRH